MNPPPGMYRYLNKFNMTSSISRSGKNQFFDIFLQNKFASPDSFLLVLRYKHRNLSLNFYMKLFHLWIRARIMIRVRIHNRLIRNTADLITVPTNFCRYKLVQFLTWRGSMSSFGDRVVHSYFPAKSTLFLLDR